MFGGTAMSHPDDADFNFDFSLLEYCEFEKMFFGRPFRRKLGPSFERKFCRNSCFYISSKPERTVAFLERLFLGFQEVAAKYTLEQVNQGIWDLFGCAVEIQRHLWDKRVEVQKCVSCIRSMLAPYRDFVCGHPVHMMENCFDMWWDLVAGAFWARFDFGHETMEPRDHVILDAMFETLRDTLALPDARCQSYALHGLGHVRHPKVFATVQSFIDAHRGLMDAEDLAWVESCRDGKVM